VLASTQPLNQRLSFQIKGVAAKVGYASPSVGAIRCRAVGSGARNRTTTARERSSGPAGLIPEFACSARCSAYMVWCAARRHRGRQGGLALRRQQRHRAWQVLLLVRVVRAQLVRRQGHLIHARVLVRSHTIARLFFIAYSS
jgi:hypothetical protein